MSGSLVQPDVSASGISSETPKARSSYPFYTPLQLARREIRLIHLKPSSNDDIVSCTLSVVSLDSNPKYTALSYVWGDPTATTAIVINGHQFQATESLAKALIRIRCEFACQDDFCLWADAICINQEDRLERSHQVQLMGEIYSGSLSLISWLDSEDGRVALGFRWIKIIAEELYKACRTSTTTTKLFDSTPRMSMEYITRASRERGEPLDLTTWPNNHPALCQIDEGEKISNEGWNAILAVAENKYWTRVWVFQELLLSHDGILLTGDGPRISIDELCLVTDWIVFVDRLTSPLQDLLHHRLVTELNIFIAGAPSVFLCSNLSRLRFIIYQYLTRGYASDSFVKRVTRLTILSQARAMEATDPKDHVYGLLGVMNASTEVVPDYSQSIKFVYCQWTRYLACLGSLEILAGAGIGASRESAYDLPSWSPDWNSSRQNLRWAYRIANGADIGLKLLGNNFEFTENANVLSADGVKIDSILSVECIPDALEDLMSKPKIFLETYMELRSRVHPTGDPPLQVFCRTLVQDIGFSELEPPKYPESVLDFAADLTSWTLDLENADVLQQLALRPETALLELMSRDFFRPSDTAQDKIVKPRLSLSKHTILRLLNDLQHLSGKSLFWTTEGYLGLANRAVVPGDIVCVLAACPFPVIIRKVESHCLLVGLCFVHGLMAGQAAQLLEQGKATMERFDIH